MSRKGAFQSATTLAKQAQGHFHRAYTIAEICERLSIPRSTFYHLRQTGQLVFLEELRPRLGRVVRYRADLVDLYASGQWASVRKVG